MIRRHIGRQSIRNVVLTLFGIYLVVVLFFYSGIQKSQTAKKQNHELQREDHNDVIPKAPRADDRLEHHQLDDMPLYVKQRSGQFTPKYKAMKDEQPGYLEPGSRLQPKESDNRAECIGPTRGREYHFIELVPDKLFVYSAFWDTRPNDFDNKHNGTFVRIMSVLRWGNKKGNPNIICKFKTPEGFIVQSEASYYEMCENHQMSFGGFILSCAVPLEVKGQPCTVKVMEMNGKDNALLKVLPIKPTEKRDKFAVCVPPLFGSTQTKRIIEFIEMTLLLGAQRIVFYDYQISEETARVLEYYQDRGVVDVIPWLYPEALEQKSWYHGQLIAVQDCLYRNMPTAEYVTFNDLDEFIVPHAHDGWSQMADQMFDQGQCAYQFNSAYFDIPQSDIPESIILSSTKRTKQLNHLRTKCMVKPYLIFEKGIHHISKPIWAHLSTVKMPEKTAFLHHYRKCTSNDVANCHDLTDDQTLLKHAGALMSGITKIRQHIKHEM